MLHKQLARREGFSLLQLTILRSLDARAGQRPSDLAEEFGLAPPAVTTLIAGLAARGWVAREPVPGDRRSVTLTLTPAARRLLLGLDRERRKLFAVASEGLTPHRMAELTAVLRRLTEELRRGRLTAAETALRAVE